MSKQPVVYEVVTSQGTKQHHGDEYEKADNGDLRIKLNSRIVCEYPKGEWKGINVAGNVVPDPPTRGSIRG